MADAIDVVGVRRRYGDKAALDGLDLQVGHGTVHALLGPNGAGMTTTGRDELLWSRSASRTPAASRSSGTAAAWGGGSTSPTR